MSVLKLKNLHSPSQPKITTVLVFYRAMLCSEASRPSVCDCDVEVSWSDRLESFPNNHW